MSIENAQVEREGYPYNLLTNFNETVRAMTEIEGEAWLNQQNRSREKGDLELTIYGASEKLKKLSELEANISKDVAIYDVYGSGGVTRWKVMGNGDIRFSSFHDNVPPYAKTKAAEAAGFKIFR